MVSVLAHLRAFNFALYTSLLLLLLLMKAVRKRSGNRRWEIANVNLFTTIRHRRPGAVQSVCPGVQVSTQHGTWIPVGTLPTCVRRSWSPSPTLSWLWWTGLPRVNLSTYGGRAFAYAGPTSWNSLPDNLKNVNLSLQSFKRHLKTFFFSSY